MENAWSLRAGERVRADVKAEVIETVEKTRGRTDWSVSRILETLGVSQSAYYGWLGRTGRLGICPPSEYLRGDPLARLSERREKLTRARQQRRERNRALLQTEDRYALSPNQDGGSCEGAARGLSLSARNMRLETKTGPSPLTSNQFPCSVPPPGARVAPQRSPILRRGEIDRATSRERTARAR